MKIVNIAKVKFFLAQGGTEKIDREIKHQPQASEIIHIGNARSFSALVPTGGINPVGAIPKPNGAPKNSVGVYTAEWKLCKQPLHG
mmetsp:Transcript_17062/g.21026  ORF Transcript_17062/g.21026 Transcript_17062/m.21026 type:complete len:86 (-) Transcript_17062:20-277(-)